MLLPGIFQYQLYFINEVLAFNSKALHAIINAACTNFNERQPQKDVHSDVWNEKRCFDSSSIDK